MRLEVVEDIMYEGGGMGFSGVDTLFSMHF